MMWRGAAAFPALLLFATGLPPAATAQTAVDPGGVATTLVTIEAPEDAPDSVQYRVEMADGFQLLARGQGVARVNDDAVRLTLTFGVSPTVAAGDVVAGRVIVSWPGSQEAQPFSIRVRARYRLRFGIGGDGITTPPEESVEFHYYLGNRGNAVDTVDVAVSAPPGWTRFVTPSRVVLAPGDTAVGTVQLVPGRDVRGGLERVVQVATESGGGRQSRSTSVAIVDATNWFGDLASLPSTVFLGSTTGIDGVGGVAIQAGGEVRPGTRMTLDLRQTDQPFAAPALRRALMGPKFRLGLTTPEWRLAAGDVFTRTDLFLGPSVHGSGVDAEWVGDGKSGALLIAAPTNGLGDEEGHLVRASSSVGTELGRFTGVVASLRRNATLFEGFSVRALGVEYQAGPPTSQLSVQAGAMEVATDSGDSELGPAFEARYRLRSDRGNLLARLRTVPATVPRTSAYGDEAALSGSLNLAGGLSALGWGYLTRSPLLGSEDPARSNGLAAGLRYSAAGARLQVTGRLRDRTSSTTGARNARESLHGVLDVAVGAVVLELDGEWGRLTPADTAPWQPIRSARAGLRWARGSQWGVLGLGWRDNGFGDPAVRADLSGKIRAGPAEIEAGIAAQLTGSWADATTLWTGTTMDVNRELAITVGFDYRPVALGDRWQLSLGVARQFALPLPIRKQPTVQGVVYEDRNGNRVRDPDEPVLEHIPVRFGPLAATTGADGSFQFMEAVQGELRIETADLPLGLMVPADVHLPAAGFVEIPVVRTAALDLTLFLDRDGDGEWDEGEDVADGVVVSVIAPSGRTRDVAANAAGRARISALSPGAYTLRIHPPATRRTGGPPIEHEISVPPGGTVERTIAVPLRQREIRVPDSQRLNLPSSNQPSEDASV